jgi:hypothetical protein
MDETILTLATLKAYLGIAADDTTQDVALGELLAVLAPWLYDVTGTWFGSPKTEEEILDYAPVVFVNHFPVLSIEGIWRDYDKDHLTANMESQDMGNVRWNKEGRIVLSGRYDFNQSRADYSDVTVKYTHGIVTVPTTVSMAAKIFAAGLWKASINDGTEVSSEQVGSYRKTYKPSNKEQVLLAPYTVGRV